MTISVIFLIPDTFLIRCSEFLRRLPIKMNAGGSVHSDGTTPDLTPQIFHFSSSASIIERYIKNGVNSLLSKKMYPI